jgi:LAGLIDADG DNA endonuclease family protein
MGSDNPVSAENQQERLIRIGWVIGFVDGEGCFSIGFVKQPDRVGRRGYRTGFQVSHEFSVTQGESSRASLELLHEFFGVGQLVGNKRYDNHKEHLLRFVVRKRSDLLETIIPFFRSHPLETAKQANFEKFSRCVEMIALGRHLDSRGLIEIAEIVETMNRRKSRKDLIRILRGHTPDTLFAG